VGAGVVSVKIDTALITHGQTTYVFDEKDIKRALMADIRLKEQPGQKVEFSWQGHYGETLLATLTITDEDRKGNK
jgi:hypothetical protein